MIKLRPQLSILLFLSFILTSCATVKSLNDYDTETFEKKNYPTSEILGTVTVSSPAFTWTSYKTEDIKTQKMFNRLLTKAKQKYGNDIELVDISIGNNQPAMTVPLYVAAGAGVLTGALMLNNNSQLIESNTNNYGGMGVALGSGLLFFFKGVKASAKVIRAEKEPKYELTDIESIQKLQIKKTLDLYTSDYEQLNYEKTEIRENIHSRIASYNTPIAIVDSGIDEINYAGGVDCHINFYNISRKKVKYVNFTVIPYNRVDDQAYSKIGRKSEAILQVINYIDSSQNYNANWGNVWYNSTIKTMKIKQIEVIYADDTREIFDKEKDIPQIYYTAEEQLRLKEIDDKIWDISLKKYNVERQIRDIDNGK